MVCGKRYRFRPSHILYTPRRNDVRFVFSNGGKKSKRIARTMDEGHVQRNRNKHRLLTANYFGRPFTHYVDTNTIRSSNFVKKNPTQ